MRPRVEPLARAARAFLEPLWPVWHRAQGRSPPDPLSAGTCQVSSLVLAAILAEAGLPARRVCGTDPARPEGFDAGQGWRGHAWVRCADLIVDVTADQFGLPPVLIVPAADPRYRAGRDTAWPEARARRRLRARAALAGWRRYNGGPMPLVTLTGRLICADAAQAALVRAHLPRHIRLTRAEPGCLSFEVTPTGDPLVWQVDECFADRAAFEAHQARTRASPWGRATAGLRRAFTVSEG